MTSISYVNPYVLAPSPLKPLKSSSRYQNLPGEPLTAHSEQKKNPNRPKNCQKSTYVDRFSYINLFFRAPSPLKPLNSSSRYQNLPGESVTAHSDHRGPLSDPIYPPKRSCFDLFSLFLTFVRLM